VGPLVFNGGENVLWKRPTGLLQVNWQTFSQTRPKFQQGSKPMLTRGERLPALKHNTLTI